MSRQDLCTHRKLRPVVCLMPLGSINIWYDGCIYCAISFHPISSHLVEESEPQPWVFPAHRGRSNLCRWRLFDLCQSKLGLWFEGDCKHSFQVTTVIGNWKARFTVYLSLYYHYPRQKKPNPNQTKPNNPHEISLEPYLDNDSELSLLCRGFLSHSVFSLLILGFSHVVDTRGIPLSAPACPLLLSASYHGYYQ